MTYSWMYSSHMKISFIILTMQTADVPISVEECVQVYEFLNEGRWLAHVHNTTYSP